MRQEAGEAREAQVGIEEHPLRYAIVARLVVLEAEVRKVVGEREEEAIGAVVMGAEEELGLGDERVPLRFELRLDAEQVLGLARQLHEVGRAARRPDGNLVQEFAGEDRRIDQLLERHGSERDQVAATLAS